MLLAEGGGGGGHLSETNKAEIQRREWAGVKRASLAVAGFNTCCHGNSPKFRPRQTQVSVCLRETFFFPDGCGSEAACRAWRERNGGDLSEWGAAPAEAFRSPSVREPHHSRFILYIPASKKSLLLKEQFPCSLLLLRVCQCGGGR